MKVFFLSFKRKKRLKIIVGRLVIHLFRHSFVEKRAICVRGRERKREEETKRLNEARLSSLIELSNMTNKSHDEITDFVLNEAIKLTGSKYGYIAFISPDEKTIQMHTWSSGIMKNFPNNNTKITIDIENVGLLGEPIRNKKPYIENDYPSNKFKKNN